jgi:hypothetical protein
VFASRSGFRPNPIGISAVRLEGIEREKGGCRLRISGADLVDGTPVLDIKPYVPWADRIEDADGGFAQNPPKKMLTVEFSAAAARAAERIQAEHGVRLRALIEGVLCLDPRPAYRSSEPGRTYGFTLYQYDIRWQVHGAAARVVSIRTRGEPV